MREVLELYKESIRIFRKNMSDFVGYKLLTSIILFIILMPAFKWLFNIFMRAKGFDYLANGLIKKFILSPQGMILALLSIVIAFSTVLLDLGGTIVISHQRIAGSEDERFVDIIKYSLSKIKYLLGFDGLIVAIYFVIIAPMFDSNLKVGIFESLKIPGFIMDVINTNTFYLTSLTIMVIVIAYLSVRWMFALHVLLLGEETNKRFLKASSKIIKNNYKKVFKKFSLLAVFELLMFLVLLIIFAIISIIALALIPEESLEIAIIGVLSFGLVSAFIYMSFALPLTLIRMTIIYHELTGLELKALDIETVSSKRIGKKFLNNKSITIGFIIVLITGTLGYGMLLTESFNQTAYKVAITAHRGSSKDAPENTLSAIKMAIENAADYAEIDVQLSKDNEIILLHDSTLLRTTGLDKLPSEVNYSDIKDLDSGSWFSDDFKDEKIPLLKDVMQASRGKLKLNIELKGSDVSPNLIKEVIALIEKENFENECVITSLKYEDLVEVERLKPSLKTGYIMFIAIGQLENMIVDFYSVEESNVTESFIDKAHSSGREVHVWTINKEESMIEMLELGVDNIITDNDATLRRIMDDKIKEASKKSVFE